MRQGGTSQRIGLVLALAGALALVALPAWAQGWGRRASSSSVGASFAYGGDDKGARLELTSRNLVWDAGYFQDDDATIYALELGWRGEDEGEAMPYVLGTGYYYSEPDVGDSDGKLGFWAGLGDFSGTDKGFYYQFRYIFNGPLEGSQGVFGYRFK